MPPEIEELLGKIGMTMQPDATRVTERPSGSAEKPRPTIGPDESPGARAGVPLSAQRFMRGEGGGLLGAVLGAIGGAMENPMEQLGGPAGGAGKAVGFAGRSRKGPADRMRQYLSGASVEGLVEARHAARSHQGKLSKEGQLNMMDDPLGRKTIRFASSPNVTKAYLLEDVGELELIARAKKGDKAAQNALVGSAEPDIARELGEFALESDTEMIAIEPSMSMLPEEHQKWFLDTWLSRREKEVMRRVREHDAFLRLVDR